MPPFDFDIQKLTTLIEEAWKQRIHVVWNTGPLLNLKEIKDDKACYNALLKQIAEIQSK
jgi:hypothetical protein